MKMYILRECWDKIINYAKAAYETEKCEIGGMAVVTKDKDGDWIIENPVILKQEIGLTTCDLDKDHLAKYYTNMAMKYKDTEFRFCWWHSHHTMGAFWSGTDLSSIDEYGDGDLSFALVVNLKEDYKCRVSLWKPIELHKDIELNIMDSEKDIPTEILAEVKAKCETRSYKTTYVNNHTLDLWKRPNGTYQVPSSTTNGSMVYTNEINTSNLTIEEENKFEHDYKYLSDKINIWMENYSKKKWTWKRIKAAIKSTNTLFEQRDSSLRIDKMSKQDLDDYVQMICFPHEIIVVVDMRYQEAFESMIEFDSYNGSYGGYM